MTARKENVDGSKNQFGVAWSRSATMLHFTSHIFQNETKMAMLGKRTNMDFVCSSRFWKSNQGFLSLVWRTRSVHRSRWCWAVNRKCLLLHLTSQAVKGRGAALPLTSQGNIKSQLETILWNNSKVKTLHRVALIEPTARTRMCSLNTTDCVEN